jgi:hypothetical protein
LLCGAISKRQALDEILRTVLRISEKTIEKNEKVTNLDMIKESRLITQHILYV